MSSAEPAQDPPELQLLSGLAVRFQSLMFSGEADPPHGRGGRSGTKGGNGVAVGAGVAVAAGFGVATCACAQSLLLMRLFTCIAVCWQLTTGFADCHHPE